LCLLVSKWFPGTEPEGDILGKALYLENEYWERMEASVANGASVAISGVK